MTTSGAEEATREPQYSRLLEIRDSVGLARFGLMANQVWYEDPRRLCFLLARYKFVSKMLSGKRDVGEVGCGDAFGSRIVQQEVERLTVYDFDPVMIADVRDRIDEKWPLEAAEHDIVEGPLPRIHDGLFSLDMIEHIDAEHEDACVGNMTASLAADGILIVGTPSLESQAYASPQSKEGHVNCKTGEELRRLFKAHFSNVLIFSMNDEVVHTGFLPMAHYLFAVCTGPR